MKINAGGSPVKSIQRGVISGNGYQDTQIDKVDILKSSVNVMPVGGKNQAGASNSLHGWAGTAGGILIDETTLRVHLNSAYSGGNAYWEVVEYA